jgi:hypothetical protein
MRIDQEFAEAGADYYDQCDRRNHEHLVRHHYQALTRLGYQVTLIPPGDGRPPQRWSPRSGLSPGRYRPGRRGVTAMTSRLESPGWAAVGC